MDENEKFIELVFGRPTSDLLERKVPKILVNKLRKALQGLKEMGASDDDLRKYGGYWQTGNPIAVWGIASIGEPLKPAPIGYKRATENLRTACDELSHYLNGGAADYVAAPVVKVMKSKVQSQRGSIPKKKIERKKAKDLWDEWMKNPSLHKNKQSFIKLVCAINAKYPVDVKTARNWFNEFRGEASIEWEERFGKKYLIPEK